ncbi:OsmC family protein [Varibaculum vaginae]|uniref:OsmC family protein n=1 Tax=Varibaculum vaginae TaxID=2364797 RepID=UPI0011C3952E|nr:OsmC family protein [Varibaculum vaginae]
MSKILWAHRQGKKHYVGQNERGAKVEIGMGENQFTPGELLQLALATCHTFSADHVFSAALGQDFAAAVGVAANKDLRRDSYSHLTVEMVADLSSLRKEQISLLREKSQEAIDKYCTVGHTLDDGASYDFKLLSE